MLRFPRVETHIIWKNWNYFSEGDEEGAFFWFDNHKFKFCIKSFY